MPLCSPGGDLRMERSLSPGMGAGWKKGKLGTEETWWKGTEVVQTKIIMPGNISAGLTYVG